MSQHSKEELSSPRNIVLLGIGAVGGMLVPAMVYVYFNRENPVASQGWAIPAATDIAFALGALSLLGSRVPASLKIFLNSQAIGREFSESLRHVRPVRHRLHHEPVHWFAGSRKPA